jgi:hypothetical protein
MADEISGAAVVNATIPAGQALSDALNITGNIDSVCIPWNWTTAANLTVQLSPDNGTTWFDVFDQSNDELMFNTTPGTVVPSTHTQNLSNKTLIRLRSGSRDAPVPQEQDVIIPIIVGP